jgi:hypothetical protein
VRNVREQVQSHKNLRNNKKTMKRDPMAIETERVSQAMEMEHALITLYTRYTELYINFIA